MLLSEEKQSTMLMSNGPRDTFFSPCLFIMQRTHSVKCVGNKLLVVYHPTSYMVVYLSMLIPLPSPASQGQLQFKLLQSWPESSDKPFYLSLHKAENLKACVQPGQT